MLVWYHLAVAHLATRLAPPACISQQSQALHKKQPIGRAIHAFAHLSHHQSAVH